MKRWPALLAAAVLFVATVPLPARADDDHEEHKYEQEAEHEGDHREREHSRNRTATPPGATPTGSPATTTPTGPAAPGPELSPLTTAVNALTADPASTSLQAALRRAASAAGTQAPALWVNSKPVAGALLPGKRMALVSLDRVAQALGAKLTQDKASGAVTLGYAEHQATLVADAETITVDGQTVAVDEPVTLRGNTLYISLRTLAEVTGTQVIYDEETGLVLVSPVH